MSKELWAILGTGIVILGGIYATWQDTQSELRDVQTEISRLNSRVGKIEGILQERWQPNDAAQGAAILDATIPHVSLN